MNDSAALLRMLEPAVRPVPSAPGGSARAGQLPIEQRSFESLLADVQQTKGLETRDAGAATDAAEAAVKANPLGALGGVCSIENASLRAIVGRA